MAEAGAAAHVPHGMVVVLPTRQNQPPCSAAVKRLLWPAGGKWVSGIMRTVAFKGHRLDFKQLAARKGPGMARRYNPDVKRSYEQVWAAHHQQWKYTRPGVFQATPVGGQEVGRRVAGASTP